METISSNPDIQAHYETCIANGCKPALAEMLALRQAPATKTDAQTASRLKDRFYHKEAEGNLIVDQVRKVNPNFSPAGKVFVGQLCDPDKGLSDEAAWVRPDEYNGHIKKVCEQRGWSAEGAVNVAARGEIPEKQPYRLADDIVEKVAVAAVAENPGVRIEEAREAVRDKLTPKDLK